MKKKNLPIRLRKANEEDISFIFNSWLKSYRTSFFARDITSTVYYTEHHKTVEHIAKNNNIIIACNENDPTQIYGYICAGQVDGILAIHYIYVKHTFRNLGIGKALLNAFEHDPAQAAVYTHHTRMADKLAAKYNMIYHPYVYINRMQDSQEKANETKKA